ncbi:hypothetical protein [Micromonospora fluostatini]|uniref:hypothetical protein n=1 Tax=Micromonospora sp. JCM 30529 TaxID=3421643 RepID=UPI003D169A55
MISCASLLALTACGGEEDAAPAAAGTTTPATSAPADSSAPAAEAKSDKEICEAAQKLANENTEAIVKAAMAGEPAPDEIKKLLTDMSTKLTELTANGSPDSAVVTGLKTINTEIDKAAAAADPLSAMGGPASLEAGKDVTTGCQKVGVTVSF